jgi:hypothetical protein
VFEVDQFGRFEQLRRLCHWSRQHGQIKLIIGYSQNLDACLAEWVEAAGARFVPLLGGSW